MSCPLVPNKNWLICVVPEENLKYAKSDLADTKTKDEEIKTYVVNSNKPLSVVAVGSNIESYKVGETVLAGNNAHFTIVKRGEISYLFFRDMDILCKEI